jgi:hypothetical protein
MDNQRGLPEYFQQTCDKPYDRHHYKIVMSDNSTKTFVAWDLAMAVWFQTASQFLSHIEVIDIKEQSQGGFK